MMDPAPALVRVRRRLMRVFFHFLYHRFAWAYDLVANLVSLGMWQEWTASVLPYLQGPRILELGFGPGHLLVAIRDAGLSAIGLDASWQMSKMAYVRLNKLVSSSLIVNGYAQYMPFATASFHQVLATFPPDFIFLPTTVREISRILIPGGDCLILPAAWITAPGLPFWLAARLFEITGQTPSDFPDWTEPFTQAGFSTQSIPISLPRSRLVIIRTHKPI